jgi:hypothetical protein
MSHNGDVVNKLMLTLLNITKDHQAFFEEEERHAVHLQAWLVTARHERGSIHNKP